jgi:hypothetical protein
MASKMPLSASFRRRDSSSRPARKARYRSATCRRAMLPPRAQHQSGQRELFDAVEDGEVGPTQRPTSVAWRRLPSVRLRQTMFGWACTSRSMVSADVDVRARRTVVDTDGQVRESLTISCERFKFNFGATSLD